MGSFTEEEEEEEDELPLVREREAIEEGRME
jgi:hypothetical protein